jgi:hypothetical protein
MSYLKLVNQTSASKIGAAIGIWGSGLLCGGSAISHIFSVPLGLVGSAIGSRFILTTTTTEMMTKDLDQQVTAIEAHFDGVNPVETDYNLYSDDPVGNKPIYSLIKDYLLNPEKGDYQNKFPSTKFFVHDYLRSSINPYYLGLDAAPAIGGIFKFLGAQTKNTVEFALTCGEVAAVYLLRPYINYALHQKGMLNDTEHFELECAKSELKNFKDVIPSELYDEMLRVAE